MTEIIVTVKQLGKKHPLLKEKKININYSGEQISLLELLEQLVTQQIEEYNSKTVEKEDEDSVKLPQDMYLPILTDTGKVGFGSIYNEKKADLQKAQETAIQAFEDGMYAVFYGDDQLENLTDHIKLSESKPFTFIRLTFLAGSYW